MLYDELGEVEGCVDFEGVDEDVVRVCVAVVELGSGFVCKECKEK